MLDTSMPAAYTLNMDAHWHGKLVFLLCPLAKKNKILLVSNKSNFDIVLGASLASKINVKFIKRLPLGCDLE